MPMHRPLVFEPERLELLAMMVEHAYAEAVTRRLLPGRNGQEARMILAGRLIGAIEAGETDPNILQDLALQDEGHATEPEICGDVR